MKVSEGGRCCFANIEELLEWTSSTTLSDEQMKTLHLTIGQTPPISNMIGEDILLSLDDDDSLVDALSIVDRMIVEKGAFPIPEQRCLLHMVYNPVQNTFYRQVGVSAYKKEGGMLNLRKDPTQSLPDGVKVILVPDGICITSWEEPIAYEEFLRAMQSD
jgi:hypothetical protein